jgi:hypothetical protein
VGGERLGADSSGRSNETRWWGWRSANFHDASDTQERFALYQGTTLVMPLLSQKLWALQAAEKGRSEGENKYSRG